MILKNDRFLLKKWVKHWFGIGFILGKDSYGCFVFECCREKKNKFSPTVCEFLLENMT